MVLGTSLTKLRCLPLLLILAVAPAFARMEFLPSDAIERRAEIQQEIVRILPWAKKNTKDFVANNFKLQEILQSTIPDYTKLAEEKPGPYTITIYKKNTQTVTAPVLAEPLFARLLQSLEEQGSFAALQSSLQQQDQQGVLGILGQDIRSRLLGGAELFQGILIGIANSQPKEIKDSIFQAGGPTQQLRALRAAAIDEQALAEKFDPRRAGVSPENTSLPELIAILDRSLTLQLDILADLTLAAAFLQNGFTLETLAQVRTDFLSHNQRLFAYFATDSAFDFGKVLEGLKKEITLKEDELRRKATSFKKNVEADYFQMVTRTVENRENYLTLFEVHPHLAVHRGCIGGDCATTSSWGFPLSPYEHVFYIFENNRPIGYMTATRLQTGAGLTLYVKDIVGSSISANVAEAIINSLPNLASYYGVETVSIAHSNFSTKENKYRTITTVFSKYDDRRIDFAPDDLLKNDFLDVGIRNEIARFPDISDIYDSPAKHNLSVGLRANPQIVEGLAVEISSGTLEMFAPGSNREALLTALIQLTVDPNFDIETYSGINPIEVRYLYHQLENPSGLELAKYYANIEILFASYGIAISNNFRNRHQELFWRGHLLASDAFATRVDSKIPPESLRYLLAVLQRGWDFKWLGKVIQRWSPVLEGNPAYRAYIQTIKTRATDSDFTRLAFLLGHGSNIAAEALYSEVFNDRREALLLSLTEGKIQDYMVGSHFYLVVQAQIRAMEEFAAGLRFGGALDKVSAQMHRDFRLNNPIENQKLQEWFYRHAFYQTEPIESDAELQAILELYARDRHGSNEKLIEFLANNKIWDRKGVSFDYKAYLATNFEPNELFFACWALYRRGDKSLAGYLSTNNYVLLEFFDSYMRNDPPSDPESFAKTAPYQSIVRIPLIQIFNSLTTYEGLEPSELLAFDLKFSDFWQYMSIKRFIIKNRFVRHHTVTLFNILNTNTHFATFFRAIMLTAFNEFSATELATIAPFMKFLLQDSYLFPYREEIEEKYDLRLHSLEAENFQCMDAANVGSAS